MQFVWGGGNHPANLDPAGCRCVTPLVQVSFAHSGDIFLDANCTIRRGDANGEDLLDSGGGGSSGPRALFISGHNASYQLEAHHENVFWTRHETQNQEGGATTLILPSTPADGSDLHINIHSFQNYVTSDFVGGTIFLQLSSSGWSSLNPTTQSSNYGAKST